MQPTEPLRVLIVEDESLVAMMIEGILTMQGWEVIANVATVPAALQAVEQGGFDIALLDVNIGGQQVFPVAEALRARGLPLVFATGYGLQGIREDLRHLPVVAKPFSPEHLVRCLRAAADGHARAASGDAPA
ncbi:response regulator [Xanthomonas sp. AM6]|uniref:response regulator n=1 Tax=Xanthomonas sp. AM6 TaxID=2982531 RepID=UPI002954D894|nr:response regulator [Xanthomonas sp. AM6]